MPDLTVTRRMALGAAGVGIAAIGGTQAMAQAKRARHSSSFTAPIMAAGAGGALPTSSNSTATRSMRRR